MHPMFLLSALLALAVPPGGPAWTVRYAVRFITDAAAPRAEVEATLAWARGRGSAPDAVELSMAGGYPGGYGAYVMDIEALGSGGAVLGRQDALAVIDAAEGRYRLPVRRDGSAAFRYVVQLAHDPASGIGFDETPHAFADGVLWTGLALFVAPDDASFEVAFSCGAGEQVTTSFAPGGGADRFVVADRDALLESYLLAGRHAVRTLDVGGATILLAVGGEASPALELFASTVETFLRAASTMLGGPPPQRAVVAITVASGEGGGAVHGRDAHVLVAGPPVEGGAGAWRRTLCHELFHLWNPALVGFDSREMWFSEGFTEYYAHRLLVQEGLLDGESFLRLVESWIEAYQGEAGGVGLREAGNLGAKNRTLIYQGGALAALSLDVAIRKASGNRRSLDGVMASLYRLCGSGAGDKVPVAEFEKLLAATGARQLGEFVERHVAGSDPLPLEKTFADAGLELRTESIATPSRDAIPALMRCPGFTATAAGILINRSDGGALRSDDLLVELAGHPVGDFGDLRRALGGREPGDEVRAVVLRNGKRSEVELRLGGDGVDLGLSDERRAVLASNKKATRAAAAIREALFARRGR